MTPRRPGADHPRATRRYAAADVSPTKRQTGAVVEGTTEFEERVDGHIAAGEVSSLRPDRIPSVIRDEDPIMLCLHSTAAEEIWEIAEIVHDYLPERGRGRPRTCGIADMVLYIVMTEVLGAMNAVELLFLNTLVWTAMGDVAVEAWPDHPERRLHPTPPNRFQVYRFREKYLSQPEVRERVEALVLAIAAKQALLMGQFNPELGSDTHPHPTRFVSADGTWEPAASNAGPEPHLDRRTGELVVRRHDPEAYPFHNNTRSRGNMWAMVSAAGPYPGTTTIFGGRYTNGRSEQDSDVAIDIVLDLKEHLPGLQGLLHDKSATAKHLDRLAADRLLLINGVSRAKGGNVAYANLGRYKFRRPDRISFDEILWTVNGHTAIQVADEHGKQFVLLDRTKVQWNPSRTPEGGWALYVEWTVPDLPDVPARMRGATVRVRHNSTEAELARGQRAGTNRRPIPEDDPDYPALAGRRQLAESLNHSLKQRRPNKRARAYGIANRTVHNYGFIIASNQLAMIQWYRYTGGDISTRFGHYKPPEPARTSNRPGAA